MWASLFHLIQKSATTNSTRNFLKPIFSKYECVCLTVKVWMRMFDSEFWTNFLRGKNIQSFFLASTYQKNSMTTYVWTMQVSRNEHPELAHVLMYSLRPSCPGWPRSTCVSCVTVTRGFRSTGFLENSFYSIQISPKWYLKRTTQNVVISWQTFVLRYKYIIIHPEWGNSRVNLFSSTPSAATTPSPMGE